MRFIETYFYKPTWWQKIIIFFLLPLSCFYCLIAFLKRKLAPRIDFGLPVVSVGNLVVGGSGKTPFIIEIARLYPHKKIAVVSRGYKRTSKGLIIVSQEGKILCSQEEAGDEPYLIAKSLPYVSVIVSKRRKEAILKAKEMGCDAVFLDDGFRFSFKKLNIVLKPKLEPYYPFCLPSGMYREWRGSYGEADVIVQEGVDYTREVSIRDESERMLLLTAIANPSRLDEFLPSVVGKVYYADHARFDLSELRAKMQEFNATSLLVTSKDLVKLEGSGIPLSVLELRLQIQDGIICQIKEYIEGGWNA
ncbi:tetraacyldisaccharide 4'-kinase [Helicobacter pametensis]|uniref:tetraacyldisaccharide 4'-kinase n=1 Tax=Helicobacter pametensis TaxID=95149 RepID=UPI0004874AF2|nr:tetraacyldisaccharide 4'-kinase [Helicobacter pametensis]